MTLKDDEMQCGGRGGPDAAAILRALATALELSASSNEDGYGATSVTLPNGWRVTAHAPDNFEIELPDGTKCTPWNISLSWHPIPI